jgi:Flp pilus assembly protein TadB
MRNAARRRRQETFWLVMTVVSVALAVAALVLALSAAIEVWIVVILGFYVVISLLWWLYLRRERQKREAV